MVKSHKALFFKYFILFVALISISSSAVYAQSSGLSGLRDSTATSLDNDTEVEPIVSDFQHYYEDVTRQSLAKLFWRLDAMNLSNEEHIDNYLRITECDIYQDYFHDEFQWAKVRDRTREYLKENAKTFSARYKFVQPLRFAEYDIQTGLFHILPDYQIDSITKYEVQATNIKEKMCNSFYAEIKHYPAGVLVTLSQPFSLKAVPMESERAQKYINEKYEQFETLDIQKKTKDNLYKYRDAYLIMKIRFFDYRGEQFASFGNYNTALTNAVLEGYEVYSDRNHTDLLYYKNFLRKNSQKSNKARLKEQYEDMLRRRERAKKKMEEKYGAGQ